MVGEALAAAGGVLASAGMGLLSALVPLVPAEAYAVTVSLKAPAAVAVLCAVALAVGQTGGKYLWFVAGHAGAKRRRSRRGEAATGHHRFAAIAARLRCRRSSAAVVLVSGALGLPPLAIVSVAAGANRMRRLDFLACCLLGRTARFSVMLLPLVFR